DNHPREWLPRCDIDRLRQVAAECIQGSLQVSSSLRATWKQGGPEIGWKPDVNTLQEAIRWMFWHDIAGRRPLTFCVECGTAFVPESAHARTFCSYACAHRVAVRQWRKKSKRRRRP